MVVITGVGLAQATPNNNSGYLNLHGKYECYIIKDDTTILLPKQSIITLPFGTHQLWVKHPNDGSWEYRDFIEFVNITASETTDVSVNFPYYSSDFSRKLIGSISPQKEPAFSPKRNKVKILRTTSLTFTILAAITAYKYMNKAERTYQDYLEAGNPEDMDELFMKTKHFDRLTGYSLIVMELGLLTTLFTFFPLN